MYRKVTIENFRGIRRLDLHNLGETNIILGDNNVGKTSLLEILWLLEAPGNPALSFNLSVFRGMEAAGSASGLSTVWKGMFRNFVTDRPITVTGIDSDRRERKLHIELLTEIPEWVLSDEDKQVLSNANDVEPGMYSTQTLRFRYEIDGKLVSSTDIAAFGTRIRGQVNEGVRRPATGFLSTRYFTSPGELASRFTKVFDTGRLRSVEAALRQLEPSLKSLSLGYTEGNPSIRGTLVGVEEPIPLHLLGGGFIHLTEILFMMTDCRDGLMLVDEIENGIYYEHLMPYWRSIRTSASDQHVQLFVTSHSRECVQAAMEAYRGKDSSRFRLYRIERDEAELRAVEYSWSQTKRAFDVGLEVR